MSVKLLIYLTALAVACAQARLRHRAGRRVVQSATAAFALFALALLVAQCGDRLPAVFVAALAAGALAARRVGRRRRAARAIGVATFAIMILAGVAGWSGGPADSFVPARGSRYLFSPRGLAGMYHPLDHMAVYFRLHDLHRGQRLVRYPQDPLDPVLLRRLAGVEPVDAAGPPPALRAEQVDRWMAGACVVPCARREPRLPYAPLPGPPLARAVLVAGATGELHAVPCGDRLVIASAAQLAAGGVR